MDTDNCVKYFGVTSKEIKTNYRALKLTPDEMILILTVLKYGDIFRMNDFYLDKDYAEKVLGIPEVLINHSEKITFSDNDIKTIKNRIIAIKRRGLWKD